MSQNHVLHVFMSKIHVLHVFLSKKHVFMSKKRLHVFHANVCTNESYVYIPF